VPISSEVSVIAGLSSRSSAVLSANGEQPYSMIPGRTHAPCVSGKRISAAEFASERGAS
jgi:hypothetical protein